MGSGASKQEKVNEGTKQPPRHFEGFPDPVKLRQAQKEYAKANVQVEKQNGVPVPHPPPNTSSELLAKQDFTAIDKIASDIRTLQYAEYDFATLSTYLCRPARNDVEKVRAFFMFIASQTPRQVFAYLGSRWPARHSPILALMTIFSKDLSDLYNVMLERLCQSAGIPVILERTDVKAVSYRVGHPVGRWGNTICLVFVDGAWRMIDQHWGSESVSADPDDEWILVEDQGATKTLSQTQKQYFREVKEFYFLTDPVDMVYSHCCETPERQLLARPLTKKEFDEIAYLRVGYFNLGMQEISHAKCVTKSDNGTIRFKFGLDKARKFKFFHNVYKSALDHKTDRFKGRDPKDFSRKFTSSDGKEMNIAIDFPWIGKYKLVVEGMEVGQPYREDICEYLIHVTTPNHAAEPIPTLPLHQDELGINGPARALGLEATVEGGTIHAKNGIARLEFTLPDNPKFDLRPILGKQDGTNAIAEDDEAILRHYRTNGKLVIYAELASLEHHLLRINILSGNREVPLLYIVIPDMKSPSWTKNYPNCKVDNGQVGNLVGDKEYRLKPLSHEEPILEAPPEGYCTIKMKQMTEKSLDIEATLSFYSYTSTYKEDMASYLFHEQAGKIHIFSARFTRVGLYALNISSRTVRKPIFQYIFNVISPDTSASPFPVIQEGWRSGLKVIEPREGQLNENTDVQFKVVVPGAKKVQLEGNGKKVDLKKEKDDLWSGRFCTDNDVPELKISADLENEFSDVLLYQVLSEEQQNEKEVGNKKLLALSQKEMMTLEDKEQKLKKDAMKKKKIKDQEIKKAEEDFENNREKYEALETKLEEEVERELKDSQPKTPDYVNLNLDDEMDDDELKMQIEHKKKETEMDWQELYKEKSKLFALERLKGAMVRRDLKEMMRSLDLCKKKKIDDRSLEEAKILIEVEHEKQNLDEATKNQEISELLQVITSVCSKKHILEHLKPETLHAQLLLERLTKSKTSGKKEPDILDLNAKTMSELRRYNNPPKDVHNVMKAALLLLGEDESATKEWKEVQRLLNPTGKQGLSRRIMNYVPKLLNKEIGARSMQIVSAIDYTNLKKQSAGAAIFYVFTKGIIQDANIGSNVKPADVERQKEIFGRLTPPESPKPVPLYLQVTKGAGKETMKK